MKKFFSTKNDYGTLLLRVGVGAAMLPFGLAKTDIFTAGSYGNIMMKMTGAGIPAFIVMLVIIGETVGSISLILGFCTRFCAASLVVIMAGAVSVMFANGYMAGYALPLLFLLSFLPLVVNGGGAWSVDQLIAKKCKK